MWITKLILNNVRSFTGAELDFSKRINVIVGHNNSGKSTILKPLLMLQYPNQLTEIDLRIFERSGHMAIHLMHPDWSLFRAKLNKNIIAAKITKNLPGLEQEISAGEHGRATYGNELFSAEEPNNFIYPFLSKRKATHLQETVNMETTRAVNIDLRYLHAKINRLSKSGASKHGDFTTACNKILGFQVSTTESKNGQVAAYLINDFNSITLDRMGEGVLNLLGLIVDLCIVDTQKLFIIEEPENDIHPEALKNLLHLIVEKSKTNQFIITTHSNIVTKYLGIQSDSKVFHVTMTYREDRLPYSVVNETRSAEERREVLEKLGYELIDFDLWNGWLFLEESSAEEIIRDHLIRWFVP